MATVSIIIPAYNEEKHIASCVRSLLRQNYRDIEIIVLDNGSRDQTATIVESLLEEYPEKVRLVKLNRNTGPGGARNFGARLARGEILLFLDADMAFPEDYVARLVEPIMKGEAEATTHEEELVHNIDNRWVKVQGQTTKIANTAVSGVARAVKKNLFHRYGGFDPSLHYHDDRTLFYKSGVKISVIKGAHCFHNNPDTAKEIFRRNYWIGRTYIAASIREKGWRDLATVAKTTILRLLDLAALPSAASWLALKLFSTVTLPSEVILLAPPAIFILLTAKMKIVNAPSLQEKIILRLLYSPAYRVIRAAGLIAGLTASLIRGITVKTDAQESTPTTTSQNEDHATTYTSPKN